MRTARNVRPTGAPLFWGVSRVLGVVSAVIGTLLLASSAVAISPVSVSPPPVGLPVPGISAVEVLCDGECSGLPRTPPTPGGSPFDFKYGVRPNLGGFDLTVSSDQNIFILGPVRAADSVRFFAESGIEVIGGSLLVEAPNGIHFETPGSIDVNAPPVLFPELMPVAPGGANYDPICACLISIPGGDLEVVTGDGSARSPSGLVILADGGIRLSETAAGFRAAALVGVEMGFTIPGVTISRAGDVFLDLSLVTLNRLDVSAGKSLVLADRSALPVPEPRPFLLLGIGLSGLASTRGRIARSSRR